MIESALESIVQSLNYGDLPKTWGRPWIDCFLEYYNEAREISVSSPKAAALCSTLLLKTL